MQTRLHVCAAVAAIVTALPNVYAGENLAPSIDGVSNGTSLKYNQNCLDIAYKNAYGEASGKPTSESDFKNYRCYVGKKVVPCTSMSEDGQTKKAEADYQDVKASTAYKFEGIITVGVTTTVTSKLTEIAYGYSNFNNGAGLSQNVGVISEKTSVSGVADLKCVHIETKRSKQCEIGITTDLYPTIKSKDKIYLDIGGKSFEVAVQASHPDGYDDVIAIGGKTQKNVMFYSWYNAGDSELFKLLSENVGKDLNFKIRW